MPVFLRDLRSSHPAQQHFNNFQSDASVWTERDTRQIVVLAGKNSAIKKKVRLYLNNFIFP